MTPAAFILAAALATSAPNLNLSCTGATLVQDGSAVTLRDNRGYEVEATGTGSGVGSVSFTVRLQIRDGVGRMNVPNAATGGMRGDAGWFPVKDLIVNDDEITGKVRLALLSTSRFSIDRRTGGITTSGGFSGTCQKEDDTRRAF